MEKQKLYLRPEQYSQILDTHCRLCNIRPDGSTDTSQFDAWVMREYGLELFTTYEIVVDFHGNRYTSPFFFTVLECSK